MSSAVTEVFHNWAHQAVNRRGHIEGKRSDGRVFYDGPRFYSYGRHYVAGYVMLGNMTALLNGRKYSVSTQSHVAACRSASRHLQQFEIPDLTDLVGTHVGPFGPERARKHVQENIAEYDRDAAMFVLTAAGVRDAGRLFDRLLKAHDKAMAARKVREDKAAEWSLLSSAKAVRDMSDSDFEDWVKRNVERRGYVASTQCKLLIAELNRYLIAANKAGQKRAATVIRARKAELKKRADLEARKESIHAMRGYAVRAIGEIRATFATLAAKRMPTKADLRAFVQACRTLAGMPRVPATASYTLDRYASKAQAALEMQARTDNRAEFQRQAAKRAEWLQGGGGRYERYSDDRGGALIRAVNVTRGAVPLEGGHGHAVLGITGGVLQTSHGAEVPLTHAIRAFRFLKLCRDKGRAWSANGHTIRVGHYSVDRVEPSGDFKAGCHVIHWQEVERLARELGVFDGPADDSALIPSRQVA